MNEAESENGEKSLRRRILDTTRHLLVRDGYQRLSMRRIARAMGYSATSIYLHFEDKDALFHTLIDEGFERLREVLRRASETHADDPVRRLEALCRGFVDFGLENPEYYEIMFMLHPEHMERYPAEKYRRARRNLELLIETLASGAEKGLFGIKEPHVSASTIWASLHGIVSLLIARRIDVRIDRDAFIETALQQTIGGVLKVDEVSVPSG